MVRINKFEICKIVQIFVKPSKSAKTLKKNLPSFSEKLGLELTVFS